MLYNLTNVVPNVSALNSKHLLTSQGITDRPLLDKLSNYTIINYELKHFYWP